VTIKRSVLTPRVFKRQHFDSVNNLTATATSVKWRLTAEVTVKWFID